MLLIIRRCFAVDWFGSMTGLAGAAMLASNTIVSPYGWVMFFLSNIAWITHGVKTKTWALVLMQSGFIITSTVGIVRWVL
jgi:hypothetical protein